MLGLENLEGVNRIVAVDMETTGNRTPTWDDVQRMPKGMRLPGVIIQVGCVELLRSSGNDWSLGERWESLVCPGLATMNPQSRKIHNIHPAVLRKAPEWSALADKFATFVGDSPLLAHAALNEIDYLNFEERRAKRVAWDVPGTYHEGMFFDTQVLGSEAYPGAPRNLDALLDRLGVDRSDRFEHHGALLDAELTGEAFIKLATGQAYAEDRVVAFG